MKKIVLLITLSYSLQLTSQTSDLIPVLYKKTERYARLVTIKS